MAEVNLHAFVTKLMLRESFGGSWMALIENFCNTRDSTFMSRSLQNALKPLINLWYAPL